MDGRSGTSFEYGRLEIFLRGFWSNICDNASFTPDSAKVACGLLGYDGGAALQFKIDRPFSQFPEEVGFESRILESQVLATRRAFMFCQQTAHVTIFDNMRSGVTSPTTPRTLTAFQLGFCGHDAPGAMG